MRNPMNILNSLASHSKNGDYVFQRIYRLLYNPEMYFRAYQNIYAKQGNMTSGTDNKTIDEMSIARINNLIDKLKDERYKPNSARRVYIPKKNGKTRPLGIPSFDDKLLQEVIRMILESIYEGYFEDTSHGFRPNRSCHTALSCVQRYYTGCKWFIEGDIEAFFDKINHDTLISILSERIKDERFLRLIRKFLNAGYIEDWKFYKTYSGTPQGGIISPILANIYLDKLDKYIKSYTKYFEKGIRREHNPEYGRLQKDIRKCERQIEKSKNEDDKKVLIDKLKELKIKRKSMPSKNEMDSNFKRLRYERYADDFIIGVIGSKEDCKKIKEDIKIFLAEKLQLTLSDEKTLTTHARKSAKFLGYEIYTRYTKETKRGVKGTATRLHNGKIVLKIPPNTIKNKLLEYGAMKIVVHNGKEIWRPMPRVVIKNNDDLEILLRYNAEIRGLYNYYSLAINSGILNNFKYIMRYSMYKTFATKYRTTKSAIIKRYRIDKDFGVKYLDSKGKEHKILFYNEGFKKKKDLSFNCDNIPNTIVYNGRTSLIERLKAEKCELCGKENVPLQMHHIRKLKDLKGRAPWEQLMIGRRRKTLALCEECHRKIHANKMD